MRDGCSAWGSDSNGCQGDDQAALSCTTSDVGCLTASGIIHVS